MPDSAAHPIKLRFLISGPDLAPLEKAAAGAANVMVREFRRAADEVERILSRLGRAGIHPTSFSSPVAGATSSASAVRPGQRRPVDPPAGVGPGASRTIHRAASPYSHPVVQHHAAAMGIIPGPGATSWASFVTGARSANAALSPLAATSSRVALSLSGLPGFLVKAGAAAFVLDRALGFLRGTIFAPVKALAVNMADAADQSRRFEVSMAAVLGSMEKARALNRGLVRDAGAGRLPFGVEALREAARIVAYAPGLSGRLSMNDNAAARVEVQRLAMLMSKLAVVSPEQGTTGAAISIRDIAEGGPGSLVSARRRFGIGPHQLGRVAARELGVSFDEAVERVQSDPALALQSLDKFIGALIPDSAAERAANLVSNRLDRLKDGVKAALARVADEGVYDDALGRLEALQKAFFAHLDTPSWEQQSRRLGASLARVLDNVAKSIVNALRAITGTRTDAGTVGGVFELATEAAEKIGALSDRLPDLGATIGAGLRTVGEAVEQAAAELAILGEQMGGGPAGWVKAWAVDKVNRLDPEAREEARLTALVKRLDAMGLGGAKVGHAWMGNGSLAQIDTRAIADPQRRLLAEQIVRAWDGVELADVRRPFYMNRLARLAVPNLDERLRGVGASDGTAGMDAARQIIREEKPLDVPNFAAQKAAVDTLLSRVSANVPADALGSIVAQGRGVFSSKINGTSGDPVVLANVFGRLRDTFAAGTIDLDRALSETRSKLEAAPDDAQLRATLDKLTAQRAEVEASYTAAVEGIGDNLIGSVSDFGAGLGAALGELTPQVAADLQDRIVSGSTSYADRVMDLLDAAGHAIDRAELRRGVPLQRRQREASALVDLELRAIDAAGETGRLRLGMNPGQIGAAVREARTARVSGLSDEVTGRARLDYLQSNAIPRQLDLLGEARTAWGMNPGDEQARTNLGTAQSNLADLFAQADALEGRLDPLRRSFERFGSDVAAALENSIGDALYGLITGTADLDDAVRNMAQSMIRSFSDIVAAETTRALLRLILQIAGSAAGGAAGSSHSYTGTTVSYSDTGAVESVRTFARGGIATRATLGVFGEAGPEALIPLVGGRVPLDVDSDGVFARLPGGRRVPADVATFARGGVVGGGLGFVPPPSMNSETTERVTARAGHSDVAGAIADAVKGAEREINLYLVRDEAEAFAMGMNRNRDALVNLMAADARRGGKLRKSLQTKVG